MALAYSIKKAAEEIDVSRATLWRLISAGEITTFKVGGRTLVRHDVLQDFVDRKSAQSCIS